MMTEVRVSERSNLDTGEARDWRVDEVMDVEMEMATATTPIATRTACATVFETRERNENGKQKRRSEAPANTWAPCNWRSRMVGTTLQQAQEPTQLH